MKNYPYYSDLPLYRSFEEFIDGIAEKYVHKTAFTYRKHPKDETPVKVSYRALSRDVHALASELDKRALSGKHCAIIGGLSYEWICTYIALQMIGSVAVPLDREWTGEDLADTVRFAECKVVFCDSDLEKKTAMIVEKNDVTVIHMRDPEETGVMDMIKSGDPYFRYVGTLNTRAMSSLVFTSGTTGKGKGVMLCQDGILSDVYNGLRLIRPGERTVVTLPPHHTFGSNIGIIALLYIGCDLYLSSGLRHIVGEMKSHKPDFMVLVPLYVETFHRRIMTSLESSGKVKFVGKVKNVSNALRNINIDLRRKLFSQILEAFGGELRNIFCGGAPLRPELIKDFDAFGIELFNCYGITECSPGISINRNDYNVPGSVGVLLPSMDIKIENPNEAGEGEICVRGANVMLGYYKDPDATSSVIDRDRFFHTGDIGKYENDVVYITGRIKNLIILSNGKNVYPEEIETAISAIPGVSDVVVYEGVSRRGGDHNQIVAEIYPDKDYLKAHDISDAGEYFHTFITNYNATATSYKRIGVVKIRKEEFPKNTLRKITRFHLDTSID